MDERILGMSKSVEILYWMELENLLQFAQEAHTDEGNTYYQIPFWIQEGKNGTFIVHEKPPEDLAMFLTKAGLGGDNPQIKRAEL